MGRPISTGYPHVEQYRPRYDPQRPMYKRQPEVPMLPVPALKETLDKYLATVRPLCKTDAEWQHTQRAVKEFAESDQAKVLQQRLEQRKDVVWCRLPVLGCCFSASVGTFDV